MSHTFSILLQWACPVVLCSIPNDISTLDRIPTIDDHHRRCRCRRRSTSSSSITNSSTITRPVMKACTTTITTAAATPVTPIQTMDITVEGGNDHVRSSKRSRGSYLCVGFLAGQKPDASGSAPATLEIRKIPVESNTISKLNEHFSKFGTVTNVQVRRTPLTNPKKQRISLVDCVRWLSRLRARRLCHISRSRDCIQKSTTPVQ